MTLVQWRHFVALAQLGSFVKAAQAQCLTQPALSRSIRALEDELGLPLFDRIGRRVELTPLGRATLSRARQLLADADELQASAPKLLGHEGGTLRIGMGAGPAALLMAPLLMQVAQTQPRLRLEIARGGTALLVQGLRERHLDALVVDARSLPPAPDLNAQHLHQMRGAFMVRPGHPLLAQAAVGFAELRAYPLAATPLSDEVARTLVERYGPQAHPDECITLRCEDLPSLVTVTAHSDAVLLAIRAAGPDLRELPMQPALEATARFALVTLARRTEPPGLALVRSLMDTLLNDGTSP